MEKIVPPVSTYISSAGAFDLEYGIFIKCAKEQTRTIKGKTPIKVKPITVRKKWPKIF